MTIFTSRGSDRGQAWTFDALLMLALMVGGIVYATQLLPVTDSRVVANDFAEAQLEQDSSDLLAVAAATSDLLNATVYWNDSTGRWVDANPSGMYTRVPPGHPLEEPFASVFDRRAVGYNVEVEYQTTDGESAVQRMVYQGTPGAHGVSVSTSVVIYDDTHLMNQGSNEIVADATSFYAPDIFPESRKYNVLQVRIVAWKR